MPVDSEEEEEVEESGQSYIQPLSQPLSQPASQSTDQPTSQSTNQSTTTTAGTSGAPAHKKSKKMGAFVDDAMATVAEQRLGSERLERRVDNIVQVEVTTQKVWVKWIGTEMTEIHDDLWRLSSRTASDCS